MLTRKNIGGEGHLLLLVAALLAVALVVTSVQAIAGHGVFRFDIAAFSAIFYALWRSWYKDEERRQLAERLRVEREIREQTRSARPTQPSFLREYNKRSRCA